MGSSFVDFSYGSSPIGPFSLIVLTTARNPPPPDNSNDDFLLPRYRIANYASSLGPAASWAPGVILELYPSDKNFFQKSSQDTTSLEVKSKSRIHNVFTLLCSRTRNSHCVDRLVTS